jgi:guanyl-specific ribonuclease Sa
MENEKTGEIDPNAEADRALEPVIPPAPESPAEAVLKEHSQAEIEAVRSGACSVDPRLEEAIRINDSFNRIRSGGPYPYERDNTVFKNKEGELPDKPAGYYHEFTVEPLSGSTRGTMRLVTGLNGEVYYTDNHYKAFVKIAGP